MDEEDKKRIVAAFTLGALTLSAAYLLKDEILSILKDVEPELEEKKEGKEKGEEKSMVKRETERVMRKEKKEEKLSPAQMYGWRGMTWDKLREILGSRYRGANIVDAYYRLTEDERMEWRKALREESLTTLDKQFVYVDSRMIVERTHSRNLYHALYRYAQGKAQFNELFRVYREELRKLYGIE